MKKLQLKSHNRVTIPDRVTAEVGIAPGDELLIEVRDGEITLRDK